MQTKVLIRETRFCERVAHPAGSRTVGTSGVAQTISTQFTARMANDSGQTLGRNVQAPGGKEKGRG